MHINCKNCNTHFKGTYCPNCSQKASTARLKVGNVLHELWHNFTHTDKGYLSLLLAMIKNPGLVIREFIEGKRKKYFNPYTFFLVTTAFLIYVIGQVYHYEDKLYDYRNEYGQYIGKHYNMIILFSFPALVLILKTVFLNRKYNYAEWITFLIFTFGFINFFHIIMQLLYFPFISLHRKGSPYTDMAGYFIFTIVLVSFIQPVKWQHWFQCVAAGFLIYFFVELIAELFALWWYGVPVEKLKQMLLN